MKRLLFLLFIIFLIPNIIFGQGWIKYYGPPTGIYDGREEVQQTTDGGYVMVGDIEMPAIGNIDVWLIKTDSQGDTLWTKTYGSPGDDRGFSVHQTSDGGYIITGSYGGNVNVTGNTNLYLIKTDGNGNQQWNKVVDWYSGPSSGNCVRQTLDGGYIITGTAFTGNTYDLCLIKTDSQGDTLWTKIKDKYAMTYTYCGDEGFSVQQTADGGYIVVGKTEEGWMNDDVWLINPLKQT